MKEILLCSLLIGPLIAMDPASPRAITVVTFDQTSNRLTIEGAAVIKVVGDQVEIKTPEKEGQKTAEEKKCSII